MVDRLDRTKEFIKRNSDFTVNIVLILNNKSVGVIYISVLKTLYFASKSIGAYKITNIEKINYSLNDLIKKSQKLPDKKSRNKFTIVASRPHLSAETIEYIDKLKKLHGHVEILQKRYSSLKFCIIAEENADIYPRFAPTMEWDTAAGHAIVSCIDAKILQINNHELFYKKKFTKMKFGRKSYIINISI